MRLFARLCVGGIQSRVLGGSGGQGASLLGENLSPFGRERESDVNMPLQNLALLHGIDERGEALDADFQPVATLDWTDAAGGAGENHIAGQQREVGRDKADDFRGLEDELLRVRVLLELAVLKLLDAQFGRVQLRFDKRAERGEGVK